MPTTLGGSLSKLGFQSKRLNFLRSTRLAVGVEADEVEDILADVDTDGRKFACGWSCPRHGLLLLIEAVKPFRLTRRSREAAGPFH